MDFNIKLKSKLFWFTHSPLNELGWQEVGERIRFLKMLVISIRPLLSFPSHSHLPAQYKKFEDQQWDFLLCSFQEKK